MSPSFFGRRRSEGIRFGEAGIPDLPPWAERWAASFNPQLTAADAAPSTSR